MADGPWVRKYDSEVPKSLSYPQISLFQFLEGAAQKYPDQICTIFQDQTLSYKDIDELSSMFAAGLVNVGLRKGDRVGLVLPNAPQFVLAYYGILKAGGIVVAANPMYKRRELEYQFSNSGVRFVLALDNHKELIDQVSSVCHFDLILLTELEADAGNLPYIVGNKPSSGASINLEDLLSSGKGNLLDFLSAAKHLPTPAVTVEPDDAAIFQYSGGTTGVPKAAVGLHRNLVANSIQFSKWLVGLQEAQEVVLAAIPLYHVYGMVIAMSMGIALGASIVLIPNPRDIHDVLKNIQKYRATLFPGVPNMYNGINRNSDVLAGEYDLTSIKACISGSAPLLRETKEVFEALTGGKLLEGYGLSEAPTATHCNPMLGENRIGSIGLPLPDIDCRIVDLETGKEILDPDQSGELIIRGPTIMKGYHDMPEETTITLRDGWLYTGDVAKMDADGYFYLVDRKKDLIKVGGFQVWPREVEEVISSHPDVLEVGVAGIMVPIHGERVKAWVVVKPGKQLTAQAIKDWCKEKIAVYKAPGFVEFVEHLPRSTVGKVLRRELVRLHYERKNLKT